MKLNRRNAAKAAVAGVIGWFMGGKSHDEPASEAVGVELIAEPCGCGDVTPESLTITISGCGAGDWKGTCIFLPPGWDITPLTCEIKLDSSETVRVANNTERPVVMNVVLYERE
jgi:hypothetical protein